MENSKHFYDDILNFFEVNKEEVTKNKENFIKLFNDFKSKKLKEYNINENDIQNFLNKISKFDI